MNSNSSHIMSSIRRIVKGLGFFSFIIRNIRRIPVTMWTMLHRSKMIT